jgi:hypothetical protein
MEFALARLAFSSRQQILSSDSAVALRIVHDALPLPRRVSGPSDLEMAADPARMRPSSSGRLCKIAH